MSEGSYNFREIEKRWRNYWLEAGTFKTCGPGEKGRRGDGSVAQKASPPLGVGNAFAQVHLGEFGRIGVGFNRQIASVGRLTCN